MTVDSNGMILIFSRKLAKIITVSHKGYHPIESLNNWSARKWYQNQVQQLLRLLISISYS